MPEPAHNIRKLRSRSGCCAAGGEEDGADGAGTVAAAMKSSPYLLGSRVTLQLFHREGNARRATTPQRRPTDFPFRVPILRSACCYSSAMTMTGFASGRAGKALRPSGFRRLVY